MRGAVPGMVRPRVAVVVVMLVVKLELLLEPGHVGINVRIVARDFHH